MKLPKEVLPGMTLRRSYTGNSGTYWYSVLVGAEHVALTGAVLRQLPGYRVAEWVIHNMTGYDWTKPVKEMRKEIHIIHNYADRWRKLPL